MSWPTHDLIRITSGKLGKKNLYQTTAARMENGDYRIIETGDIAKANNPTHNIWNWVTIETKEHGPHASLIILEGEMKSPSRFGMGPNFTLKFDGVLATRVKGGYLLSSNDPIILTRDEIATLEWTDAYAIPDWAIDGAVSREGERASLIELAWNPQTGDNT